MQSMHNNTYNIYIIIHNIYHVMHNMMDIYMELMLRQSTLQSTVDFLQKDCIADVRIIDRYTTSEI